MVRKKWLTISSDTSARWLYGIHEYKNYLWDYIPLQSWLVRSDQGLTNYRELLGTKNGKNSQDLKLKNSGNLKNEEWKKDLKLVKILHFRWILVKERTSKLTQFPHFPAFKGSKIHATDRYIFFLAPGINQQPWMKFEQGCQ